MQAPIYAIGLMSGTSIDGVDGVVLQQGAEDGAADATGRAAVVAAAHMPFPAELRARLHKLIDAPQIKLDDLGELHGELGEVYAAAAVKLQHQAGVAISVIGCHGQTIRHQPAGARPFSLQIGDAARVAARTGRPVVADFRAADIAAGGQGAPLAPAFHRAAFAAPHEHRAVVNLGGLANVTHLPAANSGQNSAARVLGFDTGPGNTLLDGWCRRHFQTACDRDGAIAARGVVQTELLDALLADPYFAKSPPKSTGREHFNLGWLDEKLAATDRAAAAPADVLATLTELTARSVAAAVNQMSPPVERIYVCGGGVHNRELMRRLAHNSNCKLTTTADLGVGPRWVEAAAFAYLAAQTIRGQTGTLPAVTGARHPAVAGAIYLPRSRATAGHGELP